MQLKARNIIGAVVATVVALTGVCVVHVATAAAATSTPIGALDVAVVVPDDQARVNMGALPSVRVAGWAIDPDSTAAIQVHVYLNGTMVGVIDATQSRTDVSAAYPSFGAAHGYDATLNPELPAFRLRLAPGANTVCTYGIDSGTDANALLGCQTVTAGRSPFGSLDVAAALPDGLLRVAGWVIDPDTVTATGVHIWVDGSFAAAAHAPNPRPDVGAAYPLYGPLHGYDLTMFMESGPHTVCSYGFDSDTAAPTVLGCKDVVA